MQYTVYNNTEARKKWLLLCLIMLMVIAQSSIITMFSSQLANESKMLSENVIDKLDWIPESVPRESEKPGEISLTYIVRKCAHFYNFFLIGILLHASRRIVGGRWKQDILWTGLGLVIAVADELHQHFVPGRSGQVQDVLIDFSGVLFGICFLKIFWDLYLRRGVKHEKK